MRRQGLLERFSRPRTTNGFEANIPERVEKEGRMELAFHSRVAKHIKERDNWTCLCGEGRKEGLKVQAAHKDHRRNNPYYNNPENGTTLCVECHLREHIHLLQTANDEDLNWAWHSVRLLAQSVWDDSFHTRGWRFKHGDTLEEDRQHLERVFDSYDIDVFEFITVKEE